MIFCFSDTHGYHDKIEIPQGTELAIFAGDESNSWDPALNANEAKLFFEWYDSVDVPVKIYIPGNHSRAVELGLINPKEYQSITPLINEGIEWMGEKIWGSPFSPRYKENHSSFSRARHAMCDVWDLIPQDTTILITHSPPALTLDLSLKEVNGRRTKELVHVGCFNLAKRIATLPHLKMCVSGHIHDFKTSKGVVRNYGVLKNSIGTFVNATMTSYRGDKVELNPGITIDMGRFTP